MKILISGISGLIGRTLSYRLGDDHEVVGLVRSSDRWQRSLGNARLIEQDLVRSLEYAKLPQKIDVVVHLAQSRHYQNFPAMAEDIFAVNIQATFNLLEYARRAGGKCFIFASSGSVYGQSDVKLSEAASVVPQGFYAASKYAAELIVASYAAFLRTVRLRFFYVYGPGQNGMLVPNLMQKVGAGEKIRIAGRQGIKLNPIHVHDAVSAIVKAIELPVSGVLNVAGDELVSLKELIDRISRVLAISAEIECDPAQSEFSQVGDNTKMKQVLSVEPAVSLDVGLRSMLPGCQECEV